MTAAYDAEQTGRATTALQPDTAGSPRSTW